MRRMLDPYSTPGAECTPQAGLDGLRQGHDTQSAGHGPSPVLAQVLVGVDSPQRQRQIEADLVSQCARILPATSAEACLALASQLSLDLILVDLETLRLTPQDAVELCRRLRTHMEGLAPILLLGPIDAVRRLNVELDLGAVDVVGWPCDRDELRAHVRAALRTKQLIDGLLHEARSDALTGAGNRLAFEASLEHAIARQRRGEPFGLLLLDVDRFKSINDSHGHEAGDDVLRRIAERLRQGCRQVDEVFRIGGDELAVILHGARHRAALQVAIRLQRLLRAGGDPALGVAFTCSLGLACSEDLQRHATGDEVVRAADARLYDAKRAGRDRLCTTTIRPSTGAGPLAAHGGRLPRSGTQRADRCVTT